MWSKRKIATGSLVGLGAAIAGAYWLSKQKQTKVALSADIIEPPTNVPVVQIAPFVKDLQGANKLNAITDAELVLADSEVWDVSRVRQGLTNAFLTVIVSSPQSMPHHVTLQFYNASNELLQEQDLGFRNESNYYFKVDVTKWLLGVQSNMDYSLGVTITDETMETVFSHREMRFTVTG